MACELIECCQFFDDHMKQLPKSAEFIKERLCHGDYQSCSRYRIYKRYGGDDNPAFLFANDVEQVMKATCCLKKHREDPGR